MNRLKRSNISLILTAVCVAVAAVFVSGCGGGSSGNSGGTGSRGSGTLSVAMSDGPASGITAVNITIDKVEANINGTWTTITSVPQTFNLLDLVTNEKILGSASIPAGTYAQVRFFPSAATVTDAAGVHTLKIPSGVQTGVKVNVDYTIGPNQITTILLDFNVNKSIIKQGNGQYLMQPVVPGVVQVLSGTITGTVTSGGNPVPGAVITATYTAGSSYAIGTAVNTSTSLADGTFKIWALLPGTYTVSASFTSAANVTTTATTTGVIVTANQNTAAGALALQ